MPIGGFNGSDPSPTLAQFQQYVADGKVHWFIGGGVGMRSDGGSSPAQAIAAWVEQNFDVPDRRRRHPVRPHAPSTGVASAQALGRVS